MTFDEARKILGGEIEPTGEEARNGWTVNSLTIYMAEREQAKAETILRPPRRKPTQTENRFRWP